MITCKCIDHKKKPKEIPQSKWIIEGEEYTVIWVGRQLLQGNILGVKLAEINLDESCHPYEYFKMSRFAFNPEDLEELLKLANDCQEIGELDFSEIKEIEEIILG